MIIIMMINLYFEIINVKIFQFVRYNHDKKQKVKKLNRLV